MKKVCDSLRLHRVKKAGQFYVLFSTEFDQKSHHFPKLLLSQTKFIEIVNILIEPYNQVLSINHETFSSGSTVIQLIVVCTCIC